MTMQTPARFVGLTRMKMRLAVRILGPRASRPHCVVLEESCARSQENVAHVNHQSPIANDKCFGSGARSRGEKSFSEQRRCQKAVKPGSLHPAEAVAWIRREIFPRSTVIKVSPNAMVSDRVPSGLLLFERDPA